MGNQFVLFDDVPLYWDAWDVMDYHLETRCGLGRALGGSGRNTNECTGPTPPVCPGSAPRPSIPQEASAGPGRDPGSGH